MAYLCLKSLFLRIAEEKRKSKRDEKGERVLNTYILLRKRKKKTGVYILIT